MLGIRWSLVLLLVAIAVVSANRRWWGGGSSSESRDTDRYGGYNTRRTSYQYNQGGSYYGRQPSQNSDSNGRLTSGTGGTRGYIIGYYNARRNPYQYGSRGNYYGRRNSHSHSHGSGSREHRRGGHSGHRGHRRSHHRRGRHGSHGSHGSRSRDTDHGYGNYGYQVRYYGRSV